MMRKFVLAAVLVLMASSAQASSYIFEGQFNRILGVGADVNLLDPFTASFSYDDDAPLFSIIESGTRARYNTGSILLDSGAFSYQATSGPQLSILDDSESLSAPGNAPRDDFFLSVRQFDAVGSGYYLLQIDMIDLTLASLDSLAIPSPLTVEHMARNGRLFLRRLSSHNVEEWSASGRFSEIQPVPETSTALLLSLGLVGLAARRRSLRS